MTVDQLIDKLVELRAHGLPGTAEVFRTQWGDDENWKDTEEPVDFIYVSDHRIVL